MQSAPRAALVPPRQIGAFTVNEKGWKAANPPHGGLIVTTSIHPDPCKKPHGDRVNQLSVLNKLDYVKLHGYEFHLVTHVIDKSLPKLCAPSQQCYTGPASEVAEDLHGCKLLLQASKRSATFVSRISSFNDPFHLAQSMRRGFTAHSNLHSKCACCAQC